MKIAKDKKHPSLFRPKTKIKKTEALVPMILLLKLQEGILEKNILHYWKNKKKLRKNKQKLKTVVNHQRKKKVKVEKVEKEEKKEQIKKIL